MVEFLLDQLSTEGEFVITADEVVEPEDGVTAIRGLKIADGKGVWFTAESLDFSWNPGRLLRGEVEFQTLSVTGIEVLRQPETAVAVEPSEDAAQPEQADGPFAWPRAPLTVRIERMALDGVEIAEPVLGHAISFNAEGAARDEGDIQSVRLSLTRTDAIAGEISFDYTRNFADNTLAVNLTAEEAPGGLVASLADLPRDAASRVHVQASGPPTDWRMTFALALADLITAEGRATIAYEGPVEVDAAFSARPGPKLPEQVAAVMGPEAELVAKASEGPDGRIDIAEGRLTSPHATLAASGWINRLTGQMDLAATLDARPGLAAPFDGVAFQGFRFEGAVQGAPGDLTAKGTLDLDRLETGPVDIGATDWTIDLTQTTEDAATTLNLSVAGLTEGLRLDRIPAETIGDAEVDVAATLAGDVLELSTARLDSKALTLSAAGRANLADETADLAFDLASPAMADIAAAYGVDATGAIDLKGRVTRTEAATDIRATAGLRRFSHPFAAAEDLEVTGHVTLADQVAFRIDGQGTAMRLDRIPAELLPRATLSAKGTLAGEDLDRLRLDALMLDSPLLTTFVDGRYDLTEQAGEIGYRVATSELAQVARLYDVPAGGRLRAEGTASLPGDGAPVLQGRAEGQSLSFDGTRYGDVTLSHDVTLSDTPSGRVDVTTSGGPVGAARVETRFRLDGDRLTLDDLSARALGLAADGAAIVNLAGPLIDGRLAVSSRDLRPLGRFAGAGLFGAVRGDVRLQPRGGRQDVAVDLAGTGIGVDGIRLGALTLRGQVRDALATPVLDVAASGRDVSGLAEGVAIARADIVARGPLSRLDVTAEIAGEAPALTGRGSAALNADLAARIDAAGAGVDATVSRFAAALGDEAISLDRPLRIAARGGTTTLRDLDLRLPDDGRIAGDLTLAGGAPARADVTLEIPDLGTLARLADAPVTGGRVRATLSLDVPRRRGTARVDANEVVFTDAPAAGAMDLEAAADWQGRQASVDATLTGQFERPVRASATLPIAVRGGLPAIAARGPVAAKIDWQGRIDDLWAQVPLPGHILTGEAVIDLGVSGDIADPEITGSARIEDGGYQNLDAGTILTDLDLDTTLAPGGDLGLDLGASDASDGRVAANGTLTLDPPAIDLTTDLTRAILVRRDDVTARIGGQIAVKGPMAALAVTGDLTVEEAEVRLVNNNPPGIVTLGDVIIKGEEPDAEDEGTSTVTLDLSIDAPGRIFVRGRGLDSTWEMALRVTGTAAEPRVTGRIERVRGSLDLVGKSFDLARGRIDFDGGTRIDPRLDVVLERETDGFTGQIIVDGTASDPTLRFGSQPSVPEDEVLPRTLFGKSRQGLTGSQAIQLGLGLATLMDGGAGTLDAARAAVGLDNLQIEQDEEGNTAVTLGKEVAEGVFVGTKQPLGEGGTSVTVEIDVFDDVTVDTEIEPGGDASVGVQWKKDF